MVGGGTGSLSRALGLTIDDLVGVDLVRTSWQLCYGQRKGPVSAIVTKRDDVPDNRG
jgi:hypothetical protein